MSEDEISDYFHRVQRVLKPCNPVVVWLSEPDVDTTFERLRARGGVKYAEQHVERTLSFPYAKRWELHGEDGARRVWSDYQSFVERILSEADLHVIRLSSAGGFEARENELLQRMGLPALVATSVPPAEAGELIGCYTDRDEPAVNVTVRYANEHLWADGLPGVWR